MLSLSMRRGDKTPDDLDRPEGNDLQTNYELHDVGDAEVAERLAQHGFRVEEWGIDRRRDDGEEGIIFDDAMDFKVYDGDGELVALLDVKTKSSPRWMGRFNARHYDHYNEHAETFDVPAFVVMFQVGSDDEIHDEFAVNVGDVEPYRSSEDDAVRSFPDGNEAVLIPHAARFTWTEVLVALKYADL